MYHTYAHLLMPKLLKISDKPSSSLLHFKSIELAEQMTLLDAQLFMRLDSSELILWVEEQNEDKSPNLTRFTEHFNNMSYWCRYTRVFLVVVAPKYQLFSYGSIPFEPVPL